MNINTNYNNNHNLIKIVLKLPEIFLEDNF
jgi:hypothetical protein